MKFGNSYILNLENNIHTIKLSNFLKTPNKKAVNINNPFHCYFTKEFSQRRNKNNFNIKYGMNKIHNINDNNIRVKIISQICNNLYNKIHKKNEISQNNTILPYKNYFNSYKNILEKSPILKKETTSQDEIGNDILIGKCELNRNFLNNNYSNNIYNSINTEKNFRNSSKIKNIPKILKRRKVDCLCQTNLSTFEKEDSDEDTEEENKKEMINLANKAIFPSLDINKKKRNDILTKKNNNNIYNRNNILSIYNSKINIFRGISYHTIRDKGLYDNNKLKTKKLLIKNKINLNLNRKRLNQDKKNIGLVNQFNLEFKIDKNSNSKIY